VTGARLRRSWEHRWPADHSNPVYAHLGSWWIKPLVLEAFGGRILDLVTLRLPGETRTLGSRVRRRCSSSAGTWRPSVSLRGFLK